MKATQVERLIAYLCANPGASGLEIVQALRIPKYTSRISDARKQGHVVECFRDDSGVDRYVVRERVRVTTGEQQGLAL